MRAKNFVIAGIILAVVLVAFSGAHFITADNDGIVEGQVYALAYTYKAVVKGSGLEGRVFDFADRNLPKPSLFVPARDARGISLIRENTTLPPGTVRKMRIRVPTMKIEGVTYPGYTYVELQYHLGTREPQSIVPTVIPKR